ncbi:hypothetical protein BDV96DRAFT_605210 [Lophiotrema nucula]|uniref:Uncharacterized protein n=1 Tax=Lophiotrema nucula TaxID=690887 RepID=A0A6A5YNW4_9PLEO|nr:hypothetical protein BDV96DRAFT_605210 [Lophiotrema nucula]
MDSTSVPIDTKNVVFVPRLIDAQGKVEGWLFNTQTGFAVRYAVEFRRQIEVPPAKTTAAAGGDFEKPSTATGLQFAQIKHDCGPCSNLSVRGRAICTRWRHSAIGGTAWIGQDRKCGEYLAGAWQCSTYSSIPFPPASTSGVILGLFKRPRRR